MSFDIDRTGFCQYLMLELAWKLSLFDLMIYIIRSLMLQFMSTNVEFSVPRIEYQIGGSSLKGSHVYFLMQVFWVTLLFCQIILLFELNVLMLQWWPDVTIVQSDVTIGIPWQLSTGSKNDYPFCNCPLDLVGILFEVLIIKVIFWGTFSHIHAHTEDSAGNPLEIRINEDWLQHNILTVEISTK